MEHQPPNSPEGEDIRTKSTPNDTPPDVPFQGTPLEKVNAYLRWIFWESDQRSEAISRDAAETIATLLGALLGNTSELARFAETGKGELEQLRAECKLMRSTAFQMSDVYEWTLRFEEFLQHDEPPTAEAI